MSIWCATCSDRPVASFGESCPFCAHRLGHKLTSPPAPGPHPEPPRNGSLVIGALGCLVGLTLAVGFIVGFLARGRS